MQWCRLVVLGNLVVAAGEEVRKSSSCSEVEEPPLHPARAALAAAALARTHKELDGALCSRELTPISRPGTIGDEGVKFMIMMESGRVGSSWLTSLLNGHSRVSSCHNEDLANHHYDVAQSWANLTKYYRQKLDPGTALGAKQKQNALLRNLGGAPLVDHLIDDFGVRLVCLSRSNPVEAFLADVNGASHQAACLRHNHYESEDADCYPDSAARAALGRAVWTDSGRLDPTTLCGIREAAARTMRFHDYCNRQSVRGARVFWLEYSDLACRFNETMTDLLAFLHLPYEDLHSKITKLTQQPSTIVPHFDALVQDLKHDTFIAKGAFSVGLLAADNCDFLPTHRHNPAFCPLS